MIELLRKQNGPWIFLRVTGLCLEVQHAESFTVFALIEARDGVSGHGRKGVRVGSKALVRGTVLRSERCDPACCYGRPRQ